MHVHHLMLVRGVGISSAIATVQEFFEKTILLHYDSIICEEKHSFSASDARFWPAVEVGVEQNKSVLQGFVEELEASGSGTEMDLVNIKQGYQSKLLHIITHFLDGFIGIDSVFYNLCDDSHWLSEETRFSINKNPGHYWLIHVDADFRDRQTAALI